MWKDDFVVWLSGAGVFVGYAIEIAARNGWIG
jgi:hypothetical protein